MFKSLISFISLFVFCLELVALPFFLHAESKQNTQVVTETATCCAKKAAAGTCSKATDGGTEGPECCVNCPVFYVMLTTEFAMPASVASLIERNYPSHNTDYIFTYCRMAWKPPNVC